MIMRNGRAPKGIDMGPLSALSSEGFSGSFVVAPSSATMGGGAHQARVSDAKAERRREHWRKAQQKRREKCRAQKEVTDG